MGIQLNNNTEVDDLYIDSNGSVHKIKSFFNGPSVTLETVNTGEIETGGFGCLNFHSYKRINTDLSKEELIDAIECLVLSKFRDDIKFQELVNKHEKSVDKYNNLVDKIAEENAACKELK